jgi:hypothetical protein
MIRNFIFVEETLIKNGLGLLLFKGLWTTNMLVQALTITFNFSNQEDFRLKLTSKTATKHRKVQSLKRNQKQKKNRLKKQKNLSTIKSKPS